jgi:hypothetical protein
MGMNQPCQKCGSLIPSTSTSCPTCHTSTIVQPLKSDDNTAVYAAVKESLELVRLRYRRIVVLLHGLTGFLGLGYFYLGFYRRGFLWLGFSFLASTLAFLLPPLRLGIIVLLGVIQLGITGYYGLNPDARDVRGELLG